MFTVQIIRNMFNFGLITGLNMLHIMHTNTILHTKYKLIQIFRTNVSSGTRINEHLRVFDLRLSFVN